MKDTEAKWAARVRAWRESGLSAEAYAEGKPFRVNTLRYWSSKLKGSAMPTSVALVEVERKVAPSTGVEPLEPVALVVEIGAARVHVAPGFDQSLLRDLVAILSGHA